VVTRAERSSLSGSQAVPDRQDYQRLASGYQLTPSNLTSYQQQADRGQTRSLVDVICDLRARDPHLAGVEQTRRAAVSGKPWELLPGVYAGQETPPEVIDACQTMLAGLAGWPELIGDCQDAVLQPLAAFELTWAISDGQAWPIAVDWVHPRLFSWNLVHEGVPGLDLGELRLWTPEEQTYGVRLRPRKWIVHQLRTRTDWPWRLGAGRPVAWMECFKSFSFAQWSIWLEVCAMPLLLASVPPETQEPDRTAVMAALESLGSNGRGVISDTAKVAFEGSGNNAGDQAYQRMAAACNDEISKCILGHTGSADTTPGRLGGEGLAGEIRQDLVESDARAIEATIKRDLLAHFVALNYGPTVAVPRLHLQVDAQISRKETMDLARQAWSMGLPVDKAWLATSTGIQLTDDPAKALPAPGPQGMAQTVAGVNAPQPTQEAPSV
jgi:phage gp29-like protein